MYYNGHENQKIRNLGGYHIEISFKLTRIDEPGTAIGHWWNGKGLVDSEVRGLTKDFGVSLMKDNRIAFGTGSPKGDSTLLSHRSVKSGDNIRVEWDFHDGNMQIMIND